jgi:rhodanese-related sulfurtransferase
MIAQLNARDLSQRLNDGDDNLVVLDVREPGEISTASLPGTLNIPMREIPARVDELPKDKDIVVMCHHGMRSMQVAGFLVQRGFKNIYNLSGGIDAWSREVDPKIPLY